MQAESNCCAEADAAASTKAEAEARVDDEYVANIRHCLDRALCIQRFPSQCTERHVVPEVELQQNPELLLKPTLIVRDDDTRCFIEGSVNSCRVSLLLSQPAELQQRLTVLYTRFLMQRADALDLLRRTPLPGYHISLLITDEHVLTMGRPALLEFVAGLARRVGSGVDGLEGVVRAHGRSVALEFLRALAF
ncbi:hypothetical protein FOA52_007489 [Chlamydomonas sp. UWO 241]|nr:hypothetical protein FOA52_007489 [Chlamydomonas sp. UWO 241]